MIEAIQAIGNVVIDLVWALLALTAVALGVWYARKTYGSE